MNERQKKRNDRLCKRTPPRFAFWIWRWGITARIFGRLFQVKLRQDELFSQRHDTRRIRIAGLSIKVFGK